MHDDLAFLLYLGNQLGLATSMVGEVVNGVGLVGHGRGKGVDMGPAYGIVGVGQQQGGCLSLTSVKQESPAFSLYLGNQLGITIMVRGLQARQWVVGTEVRVEAVGLGLGWWEGFWGGGADQHQEEVAASGAADLHQGSKWTRAATLCGS